MKALTGGDPRQLMSRWAWTVPKNQNRIIFECYVFNVYIYGLTSMLKLKANEILLYTKHWCQDVLDEKLDSLLEVSDDHIRVLIQGLGSKLVVFGFGEVLISVGTSRNLRFFGNHLEKYEKQMVAKCNV